MVLPDKKGRHPVPVLGECSNNYHQSGFYIKAKVTSIKHCQTPIGLLPMLGFCYLFRKDDHNPTIHHQNSYGEPGS